MLSSLSLLISKVLSTQVNGMAEASGSSSKGVEGKVAHAAEGGMNEGQARFPPVERAQTSMQYRFKTQAYMLALSQGKTAERAETLSNVWYNVHFLGCKYSAALMAEIEAIRLPEFEEYCQRRKL